MPIARFFVLPGFLLMLVGTPSRGAAQEAEARCAAALSSAFGQQAPAGAACSKLSVRVEDALRAAADRALVPAPSELQSRASDAAGAPAGQADSSVVQAAYPLGLGGVRLSAAEGAAGTSLFATVALNPVALFLAEDSPAFAAWGRAADLAVTVPVVAAAPTPDSKVDYLGLTLRVNALGWANGAAMASGARDVAAAHDVLFGAESEVLQRLQLGFADGSIDLEACAAAAAAGVDVLAACGVDGVRLAAALALAREARRRLREESDRSYLGVDARYEMGDPSLKGVAGERGKTLAVAAAAGYRWLLSDTQTVGLRARVGYVRAALVGAPTVHSAEYGGAVEWRSVREAGAWRLAVGVRGVQNVKNGDGALVDHDDQFDARVEISLPATDGSSLDLGLSIPLAGDAGRETVVTLGGDFELLAE